MKKVINRIRPSMGITDALQEAKRQYYKEGKIFSSALPLPCKAGECTLFDDLKNNRIFALVHWSACTGTQIIEHGWNPATLRKHLRVLDDRLRKGDNALIKHVFAVVPFEVPRYYFNEVPRYYFN